MEIIPPGPARRAGRLPFAPRLTLVVLAGFFADFLANFLVDFFAAWAGFLAGDFFAIKLKTGTLAECTRGIKLRSIDLFTFCLFEPPVGLTGAEAVASRKFPDRRASRTSFFGQCTEFCSESLKRRSFVVVLQTYRFW